MKKILGLVIMTILGLSAYGQIKFEKGYFIDNQGNRTDCLIKNTDWKDNPLAFEYKASENSSAQKATIEDVQEFGVLEYLRYKRFTLEIDRSSKNVNNLSKQRHPEYSIETLFLRQLLQGKAKLFIYEDGNLKRYFFSVNDSQLKQLVYKTYQIDRNRIGKNMYYQQQLWNEVKCDKTLMADVENTDYNKRDLVRYFQKYNSCASSDYVIFEQKNSRDLFNLYIRPRYTFSSLSVTELVLNSKIDNFDKKSNVSLGIEAEFVLPYHKNKWALTVEPTYQQFSSEGTLDTNTFKVSYKSIELPLGLRHYFFLNDGAKIFINGNFVIDLPIDSEITFEEDRTLKIKSRNNLNLGIGFNMKSRFSIELRRGFRREILSNYTYWKSNYTSYSLILGYNIF